MDRIFSGVQPSGMLHIGNYIGALKQWVLMQEKNECIFSIVNLHSITVPQDPKLLYEQSLSIAALYFACGIDPKKSIVFVQSDVSEHAEVAWVLNTITKLSELKLMHQFKDKSKQHADAITLGLFGYPVLMASDILLYKTTHVPVGEDQKQHVELARELARRFNARFGDVFIEPQPVLAKFGARIMALDNPLKKMSKSAQSIYNYIALTDSDEVIRKKIQRAVTDSGSAITYEKNSPAVSNLLTLFHACSGSSMQELEKNYEGKGYKEFKADLAEVLIEHIRPIRKQYEEHMKDKGALSTILKKGADQARLVAHKTRNEVYQKVGLR